jgi:glutamyl-tRNA synthetase/glutamyl-Q tRNA(Asp) synthetase
VDALFVWGLARAFGGRVVLRVEDHDRGRSRELYEAALLDDLEWLGLRPDEPQPAELRQGAPSAWRQSDRGARYTAALDGLDAGGLVYPCGCSRRTIRDAGGETTEGELRYPGTCRRRALPPASTPLRRVHLPPGEVTFTDLLLGPQRQVPAEQCGDLVARDRDGNWSYQFAVVVDDLEHGIDVVVRGADLLASTGRQILLRRLLGGSGEPLFLHHPLVHHPDGRKLSKSNRDTGIRDLRRAGWTAADVLAEAARRAGLGETPRPLPPEALGEVLAARFAGTAVEGALAGAAAG